MASRSFQVHESDNVATLLEDAAAGPVEVVGGAVARDSVVASESIGRGHKIALVDIPSGAPVVKFGARIGHACRDIPRGSWVHLHNLTSDLDARSGTLDLHSGAPTDTGSAYV
ncbi:MAG TPA: UxaA family hydrolase [Opitutaceae bacterium]|nr:UxaA family hydrolase [Opitutaceae bacterium]